MIHPALDPPEDQTTNSHGSQQLSFLDVLLSRGLVDAAHLVKIFNDSYILTDPMLPDNPICWCSSGFASLTGYKPEELIGRNCRFLQGPDTDPEAVEQIRHLIRTDSVGVVRLLNYTRHKQPFVNIFMLIPLKVDGRVVLFLGAQCDTNIQCHQRHSRLHPAMQLEVDDVLSIRRSMPTSDQSVHVGFPSEVYYHTNTMGMEHQAPNVQPILFENEWARGFILLKTRGLKHTHANVANYFETNNQLCEIQLQMTLLQSLPEGSEVFIGADLDHPPLCLLDWGTRLMSLAMINYLRVVFGTTPYHSFGSTSERAHIVLPFHRLPDLLVVTQSPHLPPVLSFEHINTPTQYQPPIDSTVALIPRFELDGSVYYGHEYTPAPNKIDLQVGHTYTASFGSEKVDLESWSSVGLPGVSHISLKSFFAEQELHFVCYALPPAQVNQKHIASERIVLFDFVIGHHDLNHGSF